MARHSGPLILGAVATVSVALCLVPDATSVDRETAPVSMAAIASDASTFTDNHSTLPDSNAAAQRAPAVDCTLEEPEAASENPVVHFPRFGGLDIGNGLVLEDIMKRDLTPQQTNKALARMAVATFTFARTLAREDPSLLEFTLEWDEAESQVSGGQLVLTHTNGTIKEDQYFVCPGYAYADLSELHDAATYLVNQPQFTSYCEDRILSKLKVDHPDGVFGIEVREDGLGLLARDSSGAVVGYMPYTIPGRLEDFRPPH